MSITVFHDVFVFDPKPGDTFSAGGRNYVFDRLEKDGKPWATMPEFTGHRMYMHEPGKADELIACDTHWEMSGIPGAALLFRFVPAQ